MITDIVLGVVCLSLIGAFVLYVKESNKDKAKLINALIARKPEELRDLDMADKVQIKVPTPTVTESDLIPESAIGDEEFDEQIKEQLNG